jgi:hypothetical protein
MASAQLQLISTDAAWKLDRRTVQVGRAGVAKARAALAAATIVPETETLGAGSESETPNTISHRAAA